MGIGAEIVLFAAAEDATWNGPAGAEQLLPRHVVQPEVRWWLHDGEQARSDEAVHVTLNARRAARTVVVVVTGDEAIAALAIAILGFAAVPTAVGRNAELAAGTGTGEAQIANAGVGIELPNFGGGGDAHQYQRERRDKKTDHDNSSSTPRAQGRG